ncbi:hypothetical protein MNBD_CHLOROFLEXI01-3439, partial [hydrothermal vent metagenome]
AEALLEVETMDRTVFEDLMNKTLPVQSQNGQTDSESVPDILEETETASSSD